MEFVFATNSIDQVKVVPKSVYKGGIMQRTMLPKVNDLETLGRQRDDKDPTISYRPSLVVEMCWSDYRDIPGLCKYPTISKKLRP